MASSFEDNLGKLEDIVQTLEKGDVSLDDALKAFEQGIKLSRQCQKKLDDAEKKVELLIKEDGEVVGREDFKATSS